MKNGVIRLLNRIRNLSPLGSASANHWAGDYPSWGEARAACTGYDSDAILSRCIAGYQEVKAGRAAFERDSVTFKEPEYEWPLLAVVQSAALAGSGEVRICDWGGSLGSAYFQNRHYLDLIPRLNWAVVEQSAFVAYGQKEIADARIGFHPDFRSAKEAMGGCDLLLLRGVLAYLPSPHEFLDEVASWGVAQILVQITTFTHEDGIADRLTVQHVPEWIYRASYPCWFFEKGGFLKHFESGYDIKAQWSTPAGDVNFPARRIEFHLVKKQQGILPKQPA